MAGLYIFDVDGTILDSMPMWRGLGEIYLGSKGLKAPEGLYDVIRLMTNDEAAQYMHDRFPELNLEPEVIKRQVLDLVHYQYSNVISPFPKVLELIEKLHEAGKRLIVLSTSDADCITAAFERLGILDYFEGIHTGDELGMGKQNPEIYRIICDRYGVKPEDTVMYDDSDYAITAAREAGLTVIDALEII